MQRRKPRARAHRLILRPPMRSARCWRRSTVYLFGLIVLLAAGNTEPAAASLRFHVPLPKGGPGLSAGAPIWLERRADSRLNLRRRDPGTGAKQTMLVTPANGQDQLGRVTGSSQSL